jgi:serine/threonine-protein kinase
MASMAAPKVRSVRPQVSAPLARVIDRALEFKREDRYETAAAMREDVRRAISELEVSGPTQLAVPSPLAVPAPRAASRSEPTVKPGSISASESASDQPTMMVGSGDILAPSNPFAPVPDRTEESIHLPRRRSILPWLILLALGGVGAKVWLNHRASMASAEASAAAVAPAPPASSSSSAPLPAPAPTAQAPLVVRDRDASPDPAASKTAAATPATSASGKGAPATVPTTSATHHGTPGKTTPGTVHKTPHKHHTGKAHTAAPAASGT